MLSKLKEITPKILLFSILSLGAVAYITVVYQFYESKIPVSVEIAEKPTGDVLSPEVLSAQTIFKWSMDTDLGDSDASFWGENVEDYSGGSVSGAGDVNNDGYDDFIIGASDSDDGGSNAGQTYLILGRATGSLSMDIDLSNADASFWGENADDSSGNSMSGVGDVNNDGYDDFIIGALNNDDGGSDAGQTYLILGRATGLWSMDMDLSNADASFWGEEIDDWSSISVSGVGDVNNDGYDDFVIGASENGAGGLAAGQTYLILGRATGLWSMDMDLSNADASFWGEDANDLSGYTNSLSGVGDVNNDGYDDFIIGAYGNDDGGVDVGQTYLILGRATGLWSMDMDLSNADASFWGENVNDYSGSSVSGAGDVNNDGYDDFIIGVMSNNEGGTYAGQTYLILGRATGSWTMDTDLSNADASFWGENANDYSGGSVSGVGDVNNDGYDDFIIGAVEEEDCVGQTYLILGRATGLWSMDMDLSNASASFWGENIDDWSSVSLSGAGDVNNDGYDDFIIGADGNSDGGLGAGQTYLVLGNADKYQISNLDASLDVEDFEGKDIEVGSGYGVISDTVRLKDSNGLIISDVAVALSSDPNWGSVSGDSNAVTGKSVVANLIDAPGTGSTHDLYIPIPDDADSNCVHICPEATTMGEVTAGCINGGSVCDGNTETIGGDSVTAIKVTIGGQAYIKAIGVSGTGGMIIFCGNDIQETGEVCDGTGLAGQTCITQGYDGGTLTCNASCSAFNVSGCTTESEGAVCGNDIQETGEVCDGTGLAGQTCITQGYDGGTLACNTSCSAFTTSGCTTALVCGNGIKESGESCDQSDFGLNTCLTLGYASGILGCYTNCTLNPSNCSNTLPECSDGLDNDGDNFIDYPEDPGCRSNTDDTEYNVVAADDDGESIDSDGDGLPDDVDPDDDNDGILDPDDLDDDGDGIPDNEDSDWVDDTIIDEEGNINNPDEDNDLDNDGILNGDDDDDDSDGIPDNEDTDDDNDGVPDVYDVDDDNDGIDDIYDSDWQGDTPLPIERIEEELDILPKTGVVEIIRRIGERIVQASPIITLFTGMAALMQAFLLTPSIGLGEALISWGSPIEKALRSGQISELAKQPVSVATIGVGSILQRISGIFTAFFKKRRKPWGFVFNTIDKSPIAFAIINALTNDGQLVVSAVSDLEGRFHLFLDKGVYKLEVWHSDFQFVPEKSNLTERLYNGAEFTVEEAESIGFDISMYPKERIGKFSKLYINVRNALKPIFNQLRWLVVVVGLLFSITVVIFNPSIWSIAVLILYLISVIWNVVAVGDPKKWGIVYDAITYAPIPYAKIEIFEENGERLDSQLTDKKGRYGFVENYEGKKMRVVALGYQFPSKTLKQDADCEGGILTIRKGIKKNLSLDRISVGGIGQSTMGATPFGS